MSATKISVEVERNGAYGQEPVGPEKNEYGGLKRVEVTLTGITPLLQNSMSEEEILGLWARKKKSKNAARPQPREAAASKAYVLPDGTPHVPARVLWSCFVAAGAFVRLDGKRMVSNAKSTTLASMLVIEDAAIPIYVPGSKEYPKWEVDIQQGRNPNGGEAVCIIRPRYDQWELRVTLEIDQSEMPLSMARELVEIAGKRCGLGDFRPQRKGTFGRFVINQWKPIK
jgi:hypothetical protein